MHFHFCLDDAEGPCHWRSSLRNTGFWSGKFHYIMSVYDACSQCVFCRCKNSLVFDDKGQCHVSFFESQNFTLFEFIYMRDDAVVLAETINCNHPINNQANRIQLRRELDRLYSRRTGIMRTTQ